MKQSEPLCRQFVGEEGCARDVAARSVETDDDAGFHRVDAYREHNGNCPCCSLGGQSGGGAAVRYCGNQRHPTPSEVGSEDRQSIVVIVGPAGFARSSDTAPT